MSRTTVFKVAKYLLGGIQSLMVIGTICILFGAISNSEEFKKDLEHDSNSVAFDGMHHHDDPSKLLILTEKLYLQFLRNNDYHFYL